MGAYRVLQNTAQLVINLYVIYIVALTGWIVKICPTPTCVQHCILGAFWVSVKKKHFTGASGRIRTHDLLLTSADVLTSQPPSLPGDDRPAGILYIAAGFAMFIGWCSMFTFCSTQCKRNRKPYRGYKVGVSCTLLNNLNAGHQHGVQ